MTEDRIELDEYIFPAAGDCVAAARKFIADRAVKCGFDDAAIYDIKVAVGEALANAVEHGSPKGSNNKITISCQCDNTDFVIKVKDQGVFKKTVPGTNEVEKYRGHGILLMIALMDRIVIDELSAGTVITMTKFCVHDAVKATR